MTFDFGDVSAMFLNSVGFMEVSDSQLVERARAGEFAAFETLVGRYELRAYRVADRICGARADAEDVVQESFLNVLKHLDEFRGDSSFYTWLMRIVTNQAFRVLKKRKKYVSVGQSSNDSDNSYSDIPLPQFIARWKDSPEEIVGRQEFQEMLTQELDHLDEKYRIVFLLRDMEERSTRETAEILGISEANVKVRLLRARLMLRERLTQAFGDPATQLIPDHSGHDH